MTWRALEDEVQVEFQALVRRVDGKWLWDADGWSWWTTRRRDWWSRVPITCIGPRCESGEFVPLSLKTRFCSKRCCIEHFSFRRSPTHRVRETLDTVRYGAWTVIREAERRHGNQYLWCRCDCGVERVVQRATLRDGRSAGCSKQCSRARGQYEQLAALERHRQHVAKFYGGELQ